MIAAACQTRINTYPVTPQPRHRKLPSADRPTDIPAARGVGSQKGDDRRTVIPFLGGHQKSAGERHPSLSARVCVREATSTAMHTRSDADTPASVAAEPRLRDADKTARVGGEVA